MSRPCPECGAATDPEESFCGGCGTYLEWEEAPASAPADAATPGDDVDAVDASGGTVATERAADGRPAATAATAATDPRWRQVAQQARAAPGGAPPEPVGQVAAPGAEPERHGHHPGQAAEHAAGPTGGEAPDPPADDRVVLRKPQAGPGQPRPRPRPQAADDEPLRPGDLVCGSCGAGNTPTRRFCRRCGATLADAEVVHVPWWRRVLRRRRRGLGAGTRPQPRSATRERLSRAGRLVPLLVVVALLAGGAFAGRAWLQELGATVMDRVVDAEGYEASGVSATSAAPGHPARAVIDTDPTRFWAPAGDPRGESVTARFAEPQRLVALLVSPGASVSRKAAWVAVGRPRTLVVTLSRSDGDDVSEVVELPNQMRTVRVDLGVSDVEAVTLRVRRAYPGQEEDLVALGEVEFFVRP